MPHAVRSFRNSGAIACALLLASCGGRGTPYSYEKPPAGIADTPYWYAVGDSVFWYLPSDSLAVVQMSKASTEEARSKALFATRELGWRMTVERAAGLSRSTDPQDLSQTLYAVERVGDAAGPIAGYSRFHETFWEGADTILMGLLPGLSARGEGPAQYYWPSALVVVWKPGMREEIARALIDSLGFEALTSPTYGQHYWVDRSWSLSLPAGAELFTWLRWFNRDPRVHLALPVSSHREPPTPDFRIVRRFPPRPDTLIPPGVEKLPPLLRTAWEISTFCGHTDFVENYTGLPGDAGRLRVLLRWSGPSDPKAAVEAAGGEVIRAQPGSVDAWIPFANLPGLAALPEAAAVEEVRANLLDR